MPSITNALSFSTQEEGTILQPCLAAVFFCNMSEERQWRQGILDILAEHAAMTGDVYRWTQNPDTKKWKKLSAGINSYVHPKEWVVDNERYSWTMIYHAGNRASDASDIELYTFCLGNTPETDKTSLLRVHFPLTFLSNPQGLVEHIRRWSEFARPDHGYMGFSLARSHGYERESLSANQEYRIAQRFPGIDVYDNVDQVGQLGRYIKGADWLVILSDPFLERLGGLNDVRQKMVDLPVVEYTGGAILQAGPMPQLGDREQGLPMTEYEQVAAIIEPLRDKNYYGGTETLVRGEKFTTATYREWLGRFSPKLP